MEQERNRCGRVGFGRILGEGEHDQGRASYRRMVVENGRLVVWGTVQDLMVEHGYWPGLGLGLWRLLCLLVFCERDLWQQSRPIDP